MEPREPATESDIVPAQGRFEVLAHSLEYSSIGQTKYDDMKVMQITTKADQKVAIAVPDGQDPVPYINRAVELVESGETQGIIFVPTGE